MPNISLDFINIQAVRGIRELEIPIDGMNLLIKGENGSGKSSIVDALDYYFTGNVSYFEGKRELSLRRHFPHKDYKWNDVNIELIFNPDKTRIIRTTASETESPSDFTSYFQAASEGNFILRRAQILQFILDKPRDRFSAIANIIGISEIDDIEIITNRLTNNLLNEREEKIEQINIAYQNISDMFGIDIDNEQDLLKEVNSRLDYFGVTKIKKLTDIRNSAKNVINLLGGIQDIDLIMQYKKIYEISNNPIVNDDYLSMITNTSIVIDEFIVDKKQKRELLLENLLRVGYQVLTDIDLEICPLCEQSIIRDNVISTIEKRLENLESISEKASSIIDNLNKAINIMSRFIIQLKDLHKSIESLDTFQDIINEYVDVIEDFESYFKLITTAKELEINIDIDGFKTKLQKLNKMLEKTSTVVTQLLSGIDIAKPVQEQIDSAYVINQTSSDISSIPTLKKELEKITSLYEISNIISTTFSEVKNEKIGEIYNTIRGDINSFFAILHPDDPHTDVELQLDPNRRASTNLTLTSFGEYREDPKALISEGHQDSLGLCIFLAFAKKFNGECNLIVLDDVVTAIDRQHRQKICNLFEEHFKEYQLIITTHDEVWYEQIRRYCSNYQALEIIRWTPETGPILLPYRTRWEKVKEKLDGGDKESAGNSSRQYAEWLFNEVGETVMATVPIRRYARYTMDELMTAINSRLHRLLVDGEQKKAIFKELDYIKASSFIVNWLSHDNPIISELSIEDVTLFSESVHRLHALFSCPDCSQLLKYYQDRKRMCCPKPRCRSTFEIFCK